MGSTYIDTSKLKKQYIDLSKLKKIYVDTTCYFTCGFVFKYSGNCTLNGTACTPNTEYTVESGSFNIIFTSSGTLTISSLGDYTAFDSFLCGAGNNGATGQEITVSGSEHDWYGGNGGNGGKYYTSSNFALTEGNTYSIVIGASNGADSSGFGHSSSEFTGTVAQGGLGGRIQAFSPDWYPAITVVATAGANGVYPFGDSSFGYYGSSGGGGQSYGAVGSSSNVTGPGAGGSYAGTGGINTAVGGSGTANRGAGGGGGGCNDMAGGSGSSGAVILRNHS